MDIRLRSHFSQYVLPCLSTWTVATKARSHVKYCSSYKWKPKHFWCWNLGPLPTDSSSICKWICWMSYTIGRSSVGVSPFNVALSIWVDANFGCTSSLYIFRPSSLSCAQCRTQNNNHSAKTVDTEWVISKWNILQIETNEWAVRVKR